MIRPVCFRMFGSVCPLVLSPFGGFNPPDYLVDSLSADPQKSTRGRHIAESGVGILNILVCRHG